MPEARGRVGWLRTANVAASPLVRPVTRLGQTLRTYRWATARGDLTAGATVAVVAIPQSMAYAALAHVPPQYGLYTLILQSLLGSLLTSQPLLSMGPIITQSLLTASVAGAASATIAPGDEAMYLKIVLALTLIKGVLQLGMAAARLGTLVRYVSHSVIVGFTSGAGRVDRGEPGRGVSGLLQRTIRRPLAGADRHRSGHAAAVV